MAYEDHTSSELAEMLKQRGLVSSGNKKERISRLIESDSSGLIGTELAGLERFQNKFPWATTPVIAVVAVLLIGGSVSAFIYSDEILSIFEGEPSYDLIDFDPTQARAFAEGLVALGHPQWQGRMSGTQEEHNAAQSNFDNFTSFGLSATMDSFAVPMFEIQDEPRLSICSPGNSPLGGLAPCSPPDLIAGGSETEFVHREEFVIQGYSGTADIRYQDQTGVTDLGNGSAEQNWSNAAHTIGLVYGQGGVTSNTDIFLLAQANDLAGLILVTYAPDPENPPNNCKIPGENGRCVPYFKSVDTSRFENFPDGIPFIMVSDNVGNDILDRVGNGDDLIALYTDVDNQGDRNVRVPCGVLPGETEEEIIFGGHHDTVYSGPGAVDDTSGTATVLELARQFAKLGEELGEPKYTIKFCTWGGEEEGLHGSKAYVSQYQPSLQENLRLYINLDMNHVDIDLENRGNGLWMFGNDARDTKHIRGIVNTFESENPMGLADKYNINVDTLDGPKNGPDGMPYNSDHGPFVYDIQREEGDDPGRAIVCYGSGSWEYHTFHDDMDRFNEESLAVSGIIYGTYAAWLSW
ncbi:MAG: M20/M25/M40 family metallo-hydrolase [Candidatus Thalassarchaeaceae archaeon]|nr:M20/M25/M40 family metallo-hydrolase [Candidatus Thalassarchaeaceae archaeon]